MPILFLPVLLFFLANPLSAQKPFMALNYDGYRDGQGPGIAEPGYEEVEEDIQILAPYTHGIRNYGTPDNEHGRWLPELCDKYGLNLHMGVWIDYDSSANRERLDFAIHLAKQNYNSIKSIIVGNEFLLRSDVDHNIPRDSTEKIIVDYIKYVKENVPSRIKVSSAESIYWWELHSDSLWKIADEIYFHLYPWWDNVPIENTVLHLEEGYVRIKERLKHLNIPNKKIVLAETGWPTASSNGLAMGSPENQSVYLASLHSWAKNKNLEFWYFSAFDGNWKLQYEPEVGNKWGLWNSNRTPKAVISNLDQIIPGELRWDSTQLTALFPTNPNIYAAHPIPRFQFFSLNGKKIVNPQKRFCSKYVISSELKIFLLP